MLFLSRWVGRLALLALFVLFGAGFFTAPSLGGPNYVALAFGVAFGFASWWIAVFDVP